MKQSEWMRPTQDEVRELEYTQLEENNGNGVGSGSGKKDVGVSINGGVLFALAIAIMFGLWYRTSSRSTSES